MRVSSFLCLQLLGTIFFAEQLFAKVRILTFHYNEPDFIELQHKSFKKFLLDDHEIIVINDALTDSNELKIRETCERLHIQCVRFKPEWHDSNPINDTLKNMLEKEHVTWELYDKNAPGLVFEPMSSLGSIRHSHAIQYALDHYGYTHDDVVVIADGDAFAIREFSLKKLMGSTPIIGINKHIHGFDYLWVPFIAFDPKQLPDVSDLKFHVSVIDQVMHDTGAHSYHYFKDHPSIQCTRYHGNDSSHYQYYSYADLLENGFTKEEALLTKALPRKGSWALRVEFHLEHNILHFAHSSAELWDHQEKKEYLMEFMNTILPSD